MVDLGALERNIPNPGSKEAQAIGCTCPVIDNHYGKGYMGTDGVFVYSGDCPVHGHLLSGLGKN
jgi:hypothetical protein